MPVTTVRLGHLAGEPPAPYLADYAYSEVVQVSPAVLLLDSMRDVPEGTPEQEIRRVSEAFGLDAEFMTAVARIESDLDPRERTGQYVGLFQLSDYEFGKYGHGDITNARDNAVAAAWKFASAAAVFETDTRERPSRIDLYMIHQQGEQGAAEHVAHPERAAWRSMCATDEGRQRGESWCRRAIWGNTLPAVKAVWRSVDNLTSGAFVAMWRDRLDDLLGELHPPARVAARRNRRAAHYAAAR